jgi:hypothetical protein
MNPLDLFAIVGMVSIPAVVGLTIALVKANKELDVWRGGLGRAGEERPQIPGSAPRSITPH